MALAFLNRCIWTAVSGGTGSFVVSTSAQNGYTPAGCLDPAVVNGATYHYFATQGNDHEEGDGVYTTSTSTLTRAVIRNSSNAAAAVNFSSPPIVVMGSPTSLDMPAIGSPVGSGTPNSVIFIDGSGNFAQDNTNFNWVDSTNVLTVGGQLSLGTASDALLRRDAAGIITQRNAANPQSLYIYNTTDASGAPANYERAIIDWNGSSNILQIGTQALGSGTVRGTNFIRGGTVISSLQNGTFQVDCGILAIVNTSTYIHIVNAGGGVLGWGGPNGNVTGFFQWGGQGRVTSDVSFTSTTTLGNVTGLSVNLYSGRTYAFEAQLFVTCAAAGGVKAALTGGVTASAIQYTGWTVADNAIKGKANATALNTTVGSTTTTETSGIMVQIYGTITTSSQGALIVQAAQNTSNGTATVIKQGSYIIAYDMP